MSETKASYFATDAETGGTNADIHPVLTLCLLALGDDRAVLGKLNLKILPEAPFSTCEAEAMAVNGINLEEHAKVAVSRAEATVLLTAFLETWSPKKSKGNPRLIGHNVGFDRDFIFAQLMPETEWNRYVHYGLLDTSSIIGIFKDADFLPREVGNLKSACQHYGVELTAAHDAENDILATVELYNRMIAVLKQTQRSQVGGPGVLDILER